MELNSTSFDQFIRVSNPFKDLHPEFDLLPYTLISPTALVILSSIVHYCFMCHLRPRIKVVDMQVRGYLIRSRFIETVLPYCDLEPPISPSEMSIYDIPRGNNDELFEVTVIENPKTLRDALLNIIDLLVNKFHYPKNAAYDITTIISESLQNIYEHNVDTHGFVAFQTYQTTTGQKFLEVGLSDFGAGIRETLKKNPKFQNIQNDFEAIDKAIELGTSQFDDPTRGNGLYHLMETIKKYHGTVQIRSGQATLRCRYDKEKPKNRFIVPYLPGVHITINLDAI